MSSLSSDFLVSTELELLTVPDGRNPERVLAQFFEHMRALAPTLPGPSGIFNAYGRIYIDCGHVELAAAECASPYQLPQLVECQQQLVSRAVERLRQQGCALLLANNNHSGLLTRECPIWGAHENYLVERHPMEFGALILPFLVTRIYGGAGGIEFPSGNFLAAVRPMRMERDTGGNTTSCRAIHSTSREEHHMGGLSGWYRYHLILGDGHRSHFSLALQFAATALALKAVLFDKNLPAELQRLDWQLPGDSGWVDLLKRFNIMARPGQEPAVDPRVIQVQRIYLAAATRYANRLARADRLPDWVPRALRDWEQTLTALERMDRAWLAQRLDPFIKFDFYCAVLKQAGKPWDNLAGDRAMFSELALLDHSYHEFCTPESVFACLEREELLNHRVAPLVSPGGEPQPFVPETNTRSTARARFIREHAGQDNLLVNWSLVDDVTSRRRQRLDDPFAHGFEAWEALPRTRSSEGLAEHMEGLLSLATRFFRLGEYDRAAETLAMAPPDPLMPRHWMRLRAWVQARRGHTDAEQWLRPLPARRSDLCTVNDYCFVFRFRGLLPYPDMESWVRRGEQVSAHNPEAAALCTFREHAACWYLKANRVEEARRNIEAARESPSFDQAEPWCRGRILATLGETYRVLGEPRRARRALRQAKAVQSRSDLRGDLVEMTLLSLAKLERRRSAALGWIAQARELQQRTRSTMALARILVLESRLLPGADVAQNHCTLLDELRGHVPALGECRLLSRILADWQTWLSGEVQDEETDPFWGL